MSKGNSFTGSVFFGAAISLFFFWAGGSFAQTESKGSLQQRKSRLEQEISKTNELLNQTQKDKKATINQLYLINKKIDQREQLIKTIDDEVGSYESQIQRLSDTIYRLTLSLNGLKSEYARLIYSTYRNRNAYDRLVFIFASKSFNQAYRRIKYLQQYSIYRKAQALLIMKTQKDLGEKKLYTEKRRAEKLSLKHRRELEVTQLAAEKDQKDKAIKNLTTQEKNLLRKLKENEVALNKLKAAIEAVVAEEIRKANAEKARKAALASKTEAPKAKTAAKPDPAVAKPALPVENMSSTAEEIALSSNFTGNKGRLPWPMDAGTIISTFGEHPHPEFSGIKVKNNGIDIAGAPGAKAHAVFDGVVSSVFTIANLNSVVIVRHGDFLTVYGNLSDVTVKKGDAIKTKQVLGTAQTEETGKKSRLHFELWQGTAMQNPEAWIR